jgi:hypothetical protein
MSKSKEPILSVDEEISKYRLLVADTFLQWNDERVNYVAPKGASL